MDKENKAPTKVKMRFSEPKFYNDLNAPHFEAGKIYELEGADWIQRWVKRGGEIVEERTEHPKAAHHEEKHHAKHEDSEEESVDHKEKHHKTKHSKH